MPDDCGVIVGVEEETGGKWEVGKRGGLEIWPNPCREMLKVECLMLNERNSCLLLVYDIFGREIRRISIPANEHEIQFSVGNFVPGLYLVVLKDESKIIGSVKMVVSR